MDGGEDEGGDEGEDAAVAPRLCNIQSKDIMNVGFFCHNFKVHVLED